MKYLTTLVLMSAIVVSCNQTNQDSSSNTTAPVKEYGRQNYAVVWNWITNDKQLFEDNAVTISNELVDLWKKDIIENAYFNSEAEFNDSQQFPNISFFIKAKSKREAKEILNELTVVQKNISKYSIYPVGTKWLGRQKEEIYERGITKSWVSVWTTLGFESVAEPDELVKEQNDTMIDLWKKGVVENVYFDIEGASVRNEKTDFVFFVNTNTKEEAKEILDDLPFTKEGVASYLLFPVGVFWMGEYEDPTGN